jgi:CRP-like cAMP-binding protein
VFVVAVLPPQAGEPRPVATLIRAIETLARIPPFADLPEAELQRLDTRCAWRRARAVGYILDHAEGGVDGYFVARGRARVTIQAIPGKQSILSVLGDGESFGELAAIDGKPRSGSIVAVTDRVVAKMPPRA